MSKERKELEHQSELSKQEKHYFMRLLLSAFRYELEISSHKDELTKIEILDIQSLDKGRLFPRLCIASGFAVSPRRFGLLAQRKFDEDETDVQRRGFRRLWPKSVLKPFFVGISEEGRIVLHKNPNFYLESCPACGDHVYKNGFPLTEWIKDHQRRKQEKVRRFTQIYANLFRAYERPGVLRGEGRIIIRVAKSPGTYAVFELKGNQAKMIEWHFGKFDFEE